MLFLLALSAIALRLSLTLWFEVNHEGQAENLSV